MLQLSEDVLNTLRRINSAVNRESKDELCEEMQCIYRDQFSCQVGMFFQAIKEARELELDLESENLVQDIFTSLVLNRYVDTLAFKPHCTFDEATCVQGLSEIK